MRAAIVRVSDTRMMTGLHGYKWPWSKVHYLYSANQNGSSFLVRYLYSVPHDGTFHLGPIDHARECTYHRHKWAWVARLCQLVLNIPKEAQWTPK